MLSFNKYFTIMFGLVLCLVFVLSEADANFPETEIMNNIRVNYNHDRNGDYTVWKDKPLTIVIENCFARYIWCKDYIKRGGSPSIFLPETDFGNVKNCGFSITKVTAEMNTRWGCTVLQEYYGVAEAYEYKNRKYIAKDLRFHVHVKSRQVNLKINDHSLLYNVTTTNSVDYYGNASYTCEDGEVVELTCEKSPDYTHSLDTLRLEYFNAKGNLLFKTKNRQKKLHKFRSIMKSTNNKYYIDCICASTEPGREYRYRTTFYVKKDAVIQHAIILSVNGQNLTTFSNNDKSYDDYMFRYVNGEVLNVTCQVNKYLYPKSTLYYHVDPKLIYNEDLMQSSPESGFISLKVFPYPVKNQNLTCNINNTDEDKPNARLLFSPDVPDGEVRVRGLPRNNILYQYTNDLEQWTIEYQYSVNDTINLTCVSNGGLQNPSLRPGLRNSPWFQWKDKDQTINSPVTPSTVKAITFSEKKIMKLYPTHNGTKIKCIYFPTGMLNKYYNRTVEIILRLKPELVSGEEEKREEATSDPDSPQKDPLVHMIVPIAVTVGVTVAIITMVCLVCWRRRTKRINLLENNYDTLSNENNSPIPAFPSQWEANYEDSDYNKTYEEVRQENNYNRSTDDDKLYRLPYKRESNNSENHYTEIDDYFKPKPDEPVANWNNAQSTNNNKDSNTLKAIAAHNSNTAIYNNFIDSKQGNYDQLMHHNLPINKNNEHYSNVRSKGKNKSVTFRETSRDLERRCNYSEGNSRQDYRRNEHRLKQNNDSQYANTDQNIIYMQPGDMQKKSNYENDFPQTKKTVSQLNLDPEVLDGDFEIICKNELYG